MAHSSQRYIIHVDMDAFFAAVEQRDNPDLRGKPVIVGGDPEKRGVVSTCSYEARKYGVRSAMPARTAKRLCPDAVFLPVNMKQYKRVSQEVMEILKKASPVIEPVSVDEAFLDVTERAESLDSAAAVARQIKQDIENATHLTASVGVATNKFLAKVASDLDKPDGLTVIRPENVEKTLNPLPVSRIWGVGKVVQAKLEDMGIRTIEELLRIPRSELEENFGKFGSQLYRLARGKDDSEVVAHRQRKSISSETTFDVDVDDVAVLTIALEKLCRSVAEELQSLSLKAKTVTTKVKFADFKTVTRSKSVPAFLNKSDAIYSVARILLVDACGFPSDQLRGRVPGKKVRLVGVGVSHLGQQTGQMDLFSDERRKAEAKSRIVGGIRERFGEGSIDIGRGLSSERNRGTTRSREARKEVRE